VKIEPPSSDEGIMELNGADFDQEMLGAGCPVLVQFWASGSASCRDLFPVLESVATDDSFPVKEVRVNVEHHEELTRQHAVRAAPTMLIFNRGGLQDQIIGHATKQDVHAKLRCFR